MSNFCDPTYTEWPMPQFCARANPWSDCREFGEDGGAECRDVAPGVEEEEGIRARQAAADAINAYWSPGEDPQNPKVKPSHMRVAPASLLRLPSLVLDGWEMWQDLATGHVYLGRRRVEAPLPPAEAGGAASPSGPFCNSASPRAEHKSGGPLVASRFARGGCAPR